VSRLNEMTNVEKRERVGDLYGGFKALLFPHLPDLTVTELARLRKSTRVVLVDVRASREQDVSMLPGALKASEFERQESLYVGTTVVGYCTIGLRSGLYVRKLLARGWQAFNLAGSVLAWTHDGRDLVSGPCATRKVHVYKPEWSLEADGYEAVWQVGGRERKR
jgi:rhodanese-related sulfurtransferase